jgi:hypothetical protein
MAENYSVERSGAGDVGQMSNFWTHLQTEAAAAASLLFDRSVSFRRIPPRPAGPTAGKHVPTNLLCRQMTKKSRSWTFDRS